MDVLPFRFIREWQYSLTTDLPNSILGDSKKMETKLYVGNLSYDTTEETLRSLLSQAGSVQSVDMITDRDTGRPKGFAFVTMGSQVDAEKAITMFNEKIVDNRTIKVNIARPREERPRMGGYGYRR